METFDILPHFAFLLLVFLVFLAAVVSTRNSEKNAHFKMLNLFVLFASACVFSAATILQGSGWWAPRTVYPLASVVGVLTINTLVNHRSSPGAAAIAHTAKVLSVAAVATLLVVQYFGFHKLYIDKYKLNALDENRCYYVGQAIAEYEATSGIEVRKIAFYADAESAVPTYPNLYSHSGDLICSSFNQDWSDLNALSYYLGDNYSRAEPSETYRTYFAGRNWDALSAQQLIFDGDTLHLCIY